MSCRCPSLEATATGNTVLFAALAVCKDWTDYVPAVAAIQLALKAQLQFLGPGAGAAPSGCRALMRGSPADDALCG